MSNQSARPLVDGLPEYGLRTLRWYVSRSLTKKYDIRETGRDHVPSTGPVILAGNHVGWLDGPLLVARAPRPAHAMVKAEAWEGRAGRMLSLTGQIKVQRDGRDVEAIRAAYRALRAGQVVAAYPEGRRGDGDFARIKPGVAWLAMATGAPVVPVATFGTRGAGAEADSRPAPGARIDLVYGAAISVSEQPWPRGGKQLASVTEHIRTHLKAHLAWALAETGGHRPGPLPDDTRSETTHD